MVDGRLVFRHHFWPGCSHSCLWLYHILGKRCPRHLHRRHLQLQHQEYVDTSKDSSSHANFLTVKYWIKIDDSMDVFAEHGVAGMVGLMFNALFGADYIVGLDGVNTAVANPTTGTMIGGWIIHNYRQFYIQLAYIVACTGYAFVMSAIIAYGINFIPGLHLRASEEAELLGMDDDQLGEFAYDYVEVRRDYLAWTPASGEQKGDGHIINPKEQHGIGGHSDMIDGQKTSESDSNGAHAHTGVMGDRHGVAAEEEKKMH